MPAPLGPTTPPVFVTPKEAARLLSLSRSEVYNLLDRGTLDGTRHGTRRLVVLASVHAYADTLLAAADAAG